MNAQTPSGDAPDEITKLKTDIAARDALIGELRKGIREAMDNARGDDPDVWERLEALIARAPADARAELVRLREENATMLKASQDRMANDLITIIKLQDERDALRAQLASAEAKIAASERVTTFVGMKMRAEAAEARVRELEALAQSHRALFNQMEAKFDTLEARLRAVTEAGQDLANWFSEDANGREPFHKKLARWNAAVDAARTADLPSAEPFHVSRVVRWPGGMGPDLDGVVVDKCGVMVISLDGVNVYPPSVSVEDALGGIDTNPPVSFSWDEVTNHAPADLPPHPDTERINDIERDWWWIFHTFAPGGRDDPWKKDFRGSLDRLRARELAARAQAGKEAQS